MSGVGKTRLATLLRAHHWFHYSGDYRIGTRYLDEPILDNIKQQAMQVPFLRDLLRSDSIYIANNITVDNLAPVSSFLGKIGNPELGGLSLREFKRRQALHRDAEIRATLDVPVFIDKAQEIYGYEHFVCDTSGSICEVVDPHDPADPVLSDLAPALLPVWVRGTEEHLEELVRRFDRAPKPMYYPEDFLVRLWDEYRAEMGVAPDKVDPDDFVRHGFRALMAHRLPRYQALADNWGVTVEAAEVAALRDPQDFIDLVATALARRAER